MYKINSVAACPHISKRQWMVKIPCKQYKWYP